MADFKLTQKQHEGQTLIASDPTHVMLFGGSRSGKTFLICRTIMIRALGAPGSRHGIFRFRFNNVKQSIAFDTMPKVMDLCWPGLQAQAPLNKSDWFIKLPNGSEIWYGGLDEKERSEKILGLEFSTVFLNECSQLSWSSREMVVTRLAQKVETVHGQALRPKMIYDCNPPSRAHWTYRLFIEKVSPDDRKPLAKPADFGAMQMNPIDNLVNLSANYMDQLNNMSAKRRRRFKDGEFMDIDDTALWTYELLEQSRQDRGEELPDMQRIVISVDPSGCKGEEDERSDEVGIIVVGIDFNGVAWVLEDLSGRHGPKNWAKIVNSAFERHEADRVIAEVNFGGAMVGEVIKAANPHIPFTEVRASRGKVARAEPVAELYELGKVKHTTKFDDLEDQMCAFTTSGYMGSKSPDRADALVWAVAHLFPRLTKKKATTTHQTQQRRAIVGSDKVKRKLNPDMKSKLRRKSAQRK